MTIRVNHEPPKASLFFKPPWSHIIKRADAAYQSKDYEIALQNYQHLLNHYPQSLEKSIRSEILSRCAHILNNKGFPEIGERYTLRSTRI